MATAIPLPPRQDASEKVKKPPVWSIDASGSGAETAPTPELECAETTRASGICCKEIVKKERTLIDPDVARDIIIGLSDGLTVPFALTAGLSSLGQSKLVVLGGIAELISGAISMGIGGFLASQAERDHYRYVNHQTAERVQHTCASEMAREVSAILGPVGVDDKQCFVIANHLRAVEDHELHTARLPASGRRRGTRLADPETPRSKPVNKDVGLTAFLVKFGQGLEEIPNRRMYISAITIGFGYLLGGITPLIPYFFISKAQVALIYSSCITGVVLLIFGAIKSRVTGAARNGVGYIWGAISTLMVGGVAAATAYGIVRALNKSEV